MTREQMLEAYADVYRNFSREALEGLDTLCDPDIRFRDPFHEITGRDRYKALLDGMFDQFEAPHFDVSDVVLGDRSGVLLWRFRGRLARHAIELDFEGSSVVRFGTDQRVVSHVDHWDAATGVLARLPLIGPVVRMVTRAIATRASG